MEDNYFKNDEYWKERINKELEEDIWIKDYKEYFSNHGICLDLGCGIGQYTKELMNYGYKVVSADISDLALEEVKKFNNNIVKVDMAETLPFSDNTFDVVFANLSIHFFSDSVTKKLMKEIKRILKPEGLFIGSVNGIQGYEKIKDTAIKLENHYWMNKNRCIRLFDKEDLTNYLSVFKILNIEEKVTIRFEHTKKFLIFFAKNN
jgi:SAM-dependent methyltransferase